MVACVCAICERGKLVGANNFIAGPLPADPFTYVGSEIVVCPDCLPKQARKDNSG
jgi:hypothetical protein